MRVKQALKFDIRKIKKTHRIEQVVDILWNRYKDDLSISGEIYMHRTQKWETHQISKEYFERGLRNFINSTGREPTNAEIKYAVRKYEQSGLYMGYEQRMHNMTARSLFGSIETGAFNDKAYKEFRAKALRNRTTGRFEKFDASKLQYVKDGYIINEEGQRQHYKVQAYNGVYLITWQSPENIQVTEDISWL